MPASEWAREKAKDVLSRSRVDFSDITPGYVCVSIDGTITRIAAALDEARAEGMKEERERMLAALSEYATRQLAVAKSKDEDCPASADNHMHSACWFERFHTEQLERRAIWVLTGEDAAIRAPDAEGECIHPSADGNEHGRYICGVCGADRGPVDTCLCHETTVGKECTVHDVRAMAKAVLEPECALGMDCKQYGRGSNCHGCPVHDVRELAAMQELLDLKTEPCGECGGTGKVREAHDTGFSSLRVSVSSPCPRCAGGDS